jgi:flagellar protein FliL
MAYQLNNNTKIGDLSMAEEEKEVEKTPKKENKGFNFKVIIIGLPLFVLQLVLVYFITATFLVKSAPGSHLSENGESVEETDDEDVDEENAAAQQIFSIEDLIINPAGTNGQRLLLLSVGLGVENEESLNLLKENEIIIKDLIINNVSQKTLSTLSKVELKEYLKIELAKNINTAYPKAKVKNVYFSKYLIN